MYTVDSSQASPYRRLNLWRNPFGELTLDERRELAVVEDLPELLACLQNPRAALQFLGECGHGKSTRLLALQRELPGAAYIYYPQDGPRPRLPDTRPLMIDEAQRMGFWQCRRMLHGPGPLVISTHVDMSGRLRRAGFSTQTISLDCPLAPANLARILNRRIAASTLDSTASGDDNSGALDIDLELAEKLVLRFGANVRQIEHFLYVALQNRLAGQSTWPPAL